jgi:putative hydrolase of the HAD superfamily
VTGAARPGPTDSPSTGIEAVLFDFGGVLVDSPFDAFARYEEAHGLPHGFIRSVNVTNPDSNAWARLERNEIDFDTFCDAFEAEASAAGGRVDVRELFASMSTAVRPEMVEAVRRCRQHFKTGLLTNTFVTPVAATADDAERDAVLHLFDVVVASGEVGLRKPDPRFYELACRRLEVEARRAVFLDDLGMNLKPARALGMVTIKVVDPLEALGELESVLGIALR